MKSLASGEDGVPFKRKRRAGASLEKQAALNKLKLKEALDKKVNKSIKKPATDSKQLKELERRLELQQR